MWGSYDSGCAPESLQWIILEACGASDLGSNPSTGVSHPPWRRVSAQPHVPDSIHGARMVVGSKEEVLALEERLRLGDASAEPDTSAVFDELLDEDVLFVQADGNRTGKGGVLLGHRPPRKRTFSRVVNSEVKLIEVGSAIVVSCRTDYDIGSRAFALRALRVWEPTGGRWRVKVVCLMTATSPETST